MVTTAPRKIYHVPVMLKEVIEEFADIPTVGWIVDGTFGDGGHSKEIFANRVKKFDANSLLSIDWDFSGYEALCSHGGDVPELLENATTATKWLLVKDNFAHIRAIAKEVEQKTAKSFKIAGLLLDLGISSRQYVQRNRGFSFSSSGKADMRMGDVYQVAAYDLLNLLSYNKLVQLFEQTVGMAHAQAAKLSHEIVEVRTRKAFGAHDDIDRLNEIAYKTMPIRANSVGKIHPATLLFLALRIGVNTELQNLRDILSDVLKFTVPGAKLLVMTYHSGEEAVLADFLEQNNLTGEVILPTKQEIVRNPRARSCKLTIVKV